LEAGLAGKRARVVGSVAAKPLRDLKAEDRADPKELGALGTAGSPGQIAAAKRKYRSAVNMPPAADTKSATGDGAAVEEGNGGTGGNWKPAPAAVLDTQFSYGSCPCLRSREVLGRSAIPWRALPRWYDGAEGTGCCTV